MAGEDVRLRGLAKARKPKRPAAAKLFKQYEKPLPHEQGGKLFSPKLSASQRSKLLKIEAAPIVKKGTRLGHEAVVRQDAKLAALKRQAKLHEAGLGGIGARAGLLGGEVMHSALQIPAGVVAGAKAGGEDVGSAAHGDLGFKRSRSMGEAMAKQVGADLRHPYRHPGYTFMDLLALGSAGAGAASRVGGAGRALGEGEGVTAALARPAAKGGSLLRRPAPGATSLKLGGLEVKRSLPDNPALRGVAKAWNDLQQKRLEHPQQPGQRRPLAPEHKLGRALADRSRLSGHLAEGEAHALTRMTKGLSKAEQTALRVVAIEGKDVYKTPGEAIQRHIDTHLREAESASTKQDAALHREIAADLEKAAPVLTNPSRRFLRAARDTRQFSEAMTKRAIGEKVLTPGAAKSSLDTLAKAYGRQGAGAHAFYFPTHERFIPSAAKEAGATYAPRPGQFGQAPPDKGRFTMGTLKRRSGKALKRGVVENVPRALAQVHAGREKFYSAQSVYRDALRASTDKRVSMEQIPLRRTRAISPTLRRQIAADVEKASGGDQSAMTRALQALQNELSPSEHANAKVGASVPGVRWVDKRLFKDISPQPAGKVTKVVRAVNAPFRLGGVYGRPAYIANNLPQNVVMLGLKHGARAPRGLKLASQAKRIYGRDLTGLMESATGTTRTESFLPRGHITRATQGLVGGVSRATDRTPRLAAFILRAEKKGYKGRAGIERLFHDPAAKEDLGLVSKQAKDDMVNFDVSPGERALSDAVYFWPWLSRSSIWAGRTALNQPIKTTALLQAARTPQAQKLLLQNAPAWAEGYLRLGGKVYNPNPVGPFSTQGQILQSLKAIAQGDRQGLQQATLGSEFGTPAAQTVTGSLNPKNLLSNLAQMTPESRLAFPRKSKYFPGGRKDILGSALGGAFYGRKADLGYVAEQGKKERRAAMSPEDRARASVTDKRKEYLVAAKKAGLLPKSATAAESKAIRRAWDLRTALHVAYAKAGAKTSRERFLVENALVLRLGKITPAQAKHAATWAKTASDKDLASFRRSVRDRFFGASVLEAATRQINAHGGNVSIG